MRSGNASSEDGGASARPVETAAGGARTIALSGRAHMRTIGKVGARATIAAHGVGHWQGLLKQKGWAARASRT